MLNQKIFIPFFRRDPEVFEVARPGVSSEHAMELFGEAAFAISDEWDDRIKHKTEARSWLTKVAYQLVGQTVLQGHSRVISRRIRNYDRRDYRPHDHTAIFQRGLLAIFAHNKAGPDHRLRNWIGSRLWLAFRHYVPAQFLTGFLYENASWSDSYTSREGWVIPDFSAWVLAHRASDRERKLRGTYPAEIDNHLARMRKVENILEARARRDKS